MGQQGGRGEAGPGPGPGLVEESAWLVPSGGGRRYRSARFLVRLAPWLLLASGAIFDALLPVRYSAVPMFAAAPLIAAAFYRLRAVILFDVAALTGIAVRNYQRGSLSNEMALSQIGTGIVVAVIAVVINRVVRRGNVLLASAREIAEAAQRAVLPEPPARIAGLDVAVRYEAAQAGAFIGGDFYAAQDTPHGVRFVVGDVRGKGMGAVAAVGVVIGAFREAAEQESSLEAVAQRLDHALSREASLRDRPEDTEEFATAVFAEVPHGHGTVRIVNRGHPTPLLLYPDGRLHEARGPEYALPLGMSDLGAWPDRAQELAFPTGTTLLLFTDGLTEARNAAGVFFDPVTQLRGRTFDGPRALLAALTHDVRLHTGNGGTDDLALLAVRPPPPPSADTP